MGKIFAHKVNFWDKIKNTRSKGHSTSHLNQLLYERLKQYNGTKVDEKNNNYTITQDNISMNTFTQKVQILFDSV